MKIHLNKRLDRVKSQYLLFTSAGDHSNIHHWLQGSRNFDLWVSYYGNEKNKYEDISDYHIEKKGGKFPALHYVYQHWKDILDNYQAIFIMDDDIIIDASAISRLFKIRKKYDLWLLQPAFTKKGKYTHKVTVVNPTTFLRYTNFVEVTCPLFKKEKLDEFMKVYDPILIGWGVDWWFMDVLGRNLQGKVAVIDDIVCINPHDSTKGGQREIDLLQKRSDRVENWDKIKKKYNIQTQERGFEEYGSINKNKFFLPYQKIIKKLKKIF